MYAVFIHIALRPSHLVRQSLDRYEEPGDASFRDNELVSPTRFRQVDFQLFQLISKENIYF